MLNICSLSERIQSDEKSPTEYMFLFSLFTLFQIVTVEMANIILNKPSLFQN